MKWNLFLPRFALVCLWLGCIAYASSFLLQKRGTAAVQATPTTTAQVLGEVATPAFIQVVRVVDGDTIRITRNGTETTVRLIGINTPETVAPGQPVECYGKEASNALHDLLQGRMVELVSDPSQQDVDRYGRLLRYVYMADGTFVNNWLIAQGYAVEYTYDRPYAYQKEFRATEGRAKDEKKGLWSACKPVDLPAYGETSVQ